MRNVSFTLKVLAALSLFTILYGCGSDNREPSTTAPAGEANPVFHAAVLNDDTRCVTCHGGNRHTEQVTNEDIVVQYQRSSPHIGAGGCEACHGGGAEHNGIGPIPFPRPDANRCAECHNGQRLTAVPTGTGGFTSFSSVPATNAHTQFGTSMHASPAGTHTGTCARCHTHEGALLANQAGVTGESNLFNAAATRGVVLTNLYTQFPGVYNTSFRCETCHEHGGGYRTIFALISTANGRGTSKVLWNPANTAPTLNRNNEFNLCTSCHNLYNFNGSKVIAHGTPATGGLAMQFHGTGANILRGVLVQTHKEKGMGAVGITLPFFNGSSAANGTNTRITGYYLRKTAPTGGATAADPAKTFYTDASYRGPCWDCHGHEARTNHGGAPTQNTVNEATIWTDWARSSHGGNILGAKQVRNGGIPDGGTAAQQTADAVINAFTDDTFLATPPKLSAWSHYNWDSTLKSDGTDDRGPCQMCHTATGISNYAVNQDTYDFKRNDFSHLLGWVQKSPSTASDLGGSKRQNEVLYCWGCHSDAALGQLRTTGSARLGFQIGGQPVVIQNTGNSAACVICHGGRGSASAAIAEDATRVGNRFVGHHAPTAGILYAAQTHIAFEFPGRNYANPAYRHDQINTNTDGPCASCHMANRSHTFESISSAGGVVQKINAQDLCNSCHGSLPTTLLDADKAGFAEATNILRFYLGQTNGFTNYLHLAITSSNATDVNAVPDNAYGAFQNQLLQVEEPCAYVHNPTYIRRIIFDSIDWMDDGTLNGTITINATAFPSAAAWFKASGTGAVTVSRP